MNINLISFSNHLTSVFQKKFLPSLTAQQKKIAVIASVIFGCLAVAYLINRCCCFKAKAEIVNGEGSKFDAEGNFLKGNFKDGQLHGTGEKTIKNRKIEKGEFQEGKLHGQGKKFLLPLHIAATEDDLVEEGEYQKGQLNGKGKRTYPDGTVDDGEFQNDKFISGCRTYRGGIWNGMVETGEFKNARLHEKGKRVFPDNLLVEEGVFVNGELRKE